MRDTLEQVKQRLMSPEGTTKKVWWQQVSRETGVPVGTLKKIAEGNTTDPRMSTLTALANYLVAGRARRAETVS